MRNKYFPKKDLFNFVWDDFCLTRNFWETEVEEVDEGYKISIPAPGVKREDFKIEIEGDALKVELPEGGKYCRSFVKMWKLPINTQSEEIKASYDLGVLEIMVPHVTKQKEQNIVVKVQ